MTTTKANQTVRLIRIILEGKWFIINFSVLALAASAIISFFSQNPYVGSIPLKENHKNSINMKFLSLNSLMMEELAQIAHADLYQFVINEDKVYSDFIREFNDKTEIKDAFQNSDYVANIIQNIPTDDREIVLSELASRFAIEQTSNKFWAITFEWHDEAEAQELIKNAMQSTLINVRNNLSARIFNLALAVDKENARRITSLRSKLQIIADEQTQQLKSKIAYLREQASIAEALNIGTNLYEPSNTNADSQSASDFIYAPRDFPYYIRGKSAIEKEIYILENRNPDQNLQMNEDYTNARRDLSTLKNNINSRLLREEAQILANADVKNWIELDLANSNANKQSSIIFISLGTILGALMGVIATLLPILREQIR